MEDKVKRGSLPALIMNILAPGAGLIYLHRPLRGFFCAVVIMLVFAGERFLHTLADFNGMLISVGVAAVVWLYAIVASIILAGKGLPPKTAMADLGAWIAVFMLIQGASLSMLDSLPYRSVSLEVMGDEGTLEHHYLMVYTAPKDMERRFLGQERLAPGDTVVLTRGSDTCLSRLWGMPGDVLEVRDHKLYRNTQPVLDANVTLPNNSEYWVVPQDIIFAWGCSEAEDAPENGVAHVSALYGKPLYIYWSDDRSLIGTLPCMIAQ